jgi:glutamate racemase
VPVVGVLTPEAHAAVQATRNRRIGLLATKATVESGRYAQLVRTLDAGARLTAVACPRLVPLIESDDPFGEETVAAVRDYARPLQNAGVDTVILGCTHYPLVAPMLQRMLGRDVRLVTAGHALAAAAQRTLVIRGISTENRGEGTYRFLCTGDIASFRTLGTRFLQMPLGEVERVQFETPGAATL